MKLSIDRQISAYAKLLELIDAGVVNPVIQRGLPQCLYDHKTADGKANHCGVGALFSPAQLADIVQRGLNDYGIDSVAAKIGFDNVEQATGLRLSSLRSLQRKHDRITMACETGHYTCDQASSAMRAYVVKCLTSLHHRSWARSRRG